MKTGSGLTQAVDYPPVAGTHSAAATLCCVRA